MCHKIRRFKKTVLGNQVTITVHVAAEAKKTNKKKTYRNCAFNNRYAGQNRGSSALLWTTFPLRRAKTHYERVCGENKHQAGG